MNLGANVGTLFLRVSLVPDRTGFDLVRQRLVHFRGAEPRCSGHNEPRRKTYGDAGSQAVHDGCPKQTSRGVVSAGSIWIARLDLLTHGVVDVLLVALDYVARRLLRLGYVRVVDQRAHAVTADIGPAGIVIRVAVTVEGRGAGPDWEGVGTGFAPSGGVVVTTGCWTATAEGPLVGPHAASPNAQISKAQTATAFRLMFRSPASNDAQLLLQFIVPAFAPLDPVQCMFDMSGISAFGMPMLEASGLSTSVPTPWPPV